VQPLLAAVSATKKETCEKSCCKSSEKKEAKTNNNCCKDGVCNPLVSCSCCLYVAFKSDEVKLQKLNETEAVNSTDEINLTSSYSSSCFHPPQIS
jgi:hypothetical protein